MAGIPIRIVVSVDKDLPTVLDKLMQFWLSNYGKLERPFGFLFESPFIPSEEVGSTPFPIKRNQGNSSLYTNSYSVDSE